MGSPLCICGHVTNARGVQEKQPEDTWTDVRSQALSAGFPAQTTGILTGATWPHARQPSRSCRRSAGTCPATGGRPGNAGQQESCRRLLRTRFGQDLGHLEAAVAIAGVIKVLLAFKRGTLPGRLRDDRMSLRRCRELCGPGDLAPSNAIDP